MKKPAQYAQRCCSASFHFSFCSVHQLVIIPETASFPNYELLPCQPATCTCIAKLSSKVIEDAIGKARDGFSCLFPSAQVAAVVHEQSKSSTGCKAQARHKRP